MVAAARPLSDDPPAADVESSDLPAAQLCLLEQVALLQARLRKRDEQRRALLHILGDLNALNKRLSDQRKAMLHILVDYEQDRRRLAAQTERLDNSRRALLRILQDAHQANLRLERSRKAMIHIMGDLRETTAAIQRREQELRDKQEQLVQAGKMAMLGELTTGIAHELNNPLNNIGLFVGNAIDRLELGMADQQLVLGELHNALQQVRKATEIISHLRTFGRAATVSREPVNLGEVIERAVALMQAQLRLRQITVQLALSPQRPTVIGNAIQLEQVFINLLANARDAVADAPRKLIAIRCTVEGGQACVTVRDTGPGIPEGLEQRIFDPFFTTKDVGTGTGLGLSITYSIVEEHQGTVAVANSPQGGAEFVLALPLAPDLSVAPADDVR
jgi:C4-dicarboxylate-specific signal transduction histidine kinase